MVVLILINGVFNSYNPSFPRKNHASFLISRVGWIEDLGDLPCKNERLFHIPNIFEINCGESILILGNTLCTMHPVASKDGYLEARIGEFPNLLNLTIIRNLLHVIVISIYTNTAILVGAFLILRNGVKCVAVYIISFIARDCE